MQRRSFIKALSGLAPYPAFDRAAPQPTMPPAPVLVTPQESPRHRGEALRTHLRLGEPARLVCEPENHHDSRAVVVYRGLSTDEV